MAKNENVQLVPALKNSHLVFTELLHHPEGQTAATLSKNLDIPISSMYRIINTLLNLGYIRVVKPGTKYVLGTQFIPFAKSVLSTVNLTAIVAPHLANLCSVLEETVKFSVLEGNLVYVKKVEEPKKLLHISISLDFPFPLHVGAASKVLLAFCGKNLDDPTLKLAEPFESFTKHTITTKSQLQKEIEKIRVDSLAFDNQEYIEGVGAVAVPVFDALHVVAGAISVPYFISNTKDKQIKSIIAELQKASQAISRELASMETNNYTVRELNREA
jgi:DNA-binding IclR family transcriptional regulator